MVCVCVCVCVGRFAKNLSPDKINLSTLKGEGQLTNLELDEEVLQSLLDLPTWLAINRVGCNKATIRIPWTKLKTHPISLTLDKVVMEMSTCDEPRPPNGPSPIATASGQSEYGFAEKVVEGMSLSINSIVVRISAKAFNASFELSQLQVYSVNTSWSLSDLRFTRITDPQRGEILTFKEISWQMIRIEADAIQSAEHEMLSAPIRLITNQSKIRVTLKRRMKDCYVVASKLVLILDDLLWVLTDSQLKAMVQYAKSLSEAMERSAQQRKSMASEEQGSSPPPTQQVRTAASSAAADQTASMARLFSAYDVCETSHHLQITHLDLHICDDTHSPDKVSNKRLTGGAMQLSFSLITLDYYPLHRAGDSCLHWMHYSEATKAREGWARSLLDEFKVNVELLKGVVRDQQGPSAAQGSPQHGKISTGSTSFSPPPPQSPKTQLMSSSVVLRMADFCIYQVSTADQRRSSPKAMVSCNKKTLYLPPEMPAVHVEFTEYYFPDGKDYPIPCPNLYVQLNALQLVLDPGSLVWLNLFALDLRQSLEQFMDLYKLDASQKPDEHVDIKVDGLMLKLVVPTERDASYPPDLPRSVSVQTSEMVATNTRHHPSCGRTHLQALLTAFQQEAFFCSSSGHAFPRGGPSPSDQGPSFDLLHPAFWRHAQERDTPLNGVYAGTGGPAALSGHALRPAAAADVWALHFAQFWVDYEGKGRRPQPFVDSFPLAVWACQPGGAPPPRPEASLSRSGSEEALGRLQRKRLLKEYYSTEGGAEPGAGPAPPPSNGLQEPRDPTSADVHVLVHVQKHLSAQVSHRQYMFLMRLQRSLKALPPGDPDPRLFGVCLGLLLRSAEVALLLQPVPRHPGAGQRRRRGRGLRRGPDSGLGLGLGLGGLKYCIHYDVFCAFACVCSGRLMKERSQSSFSVSYKTVKKSPSLQSLDNISIDSYLMEDTDLERGTRTHTDTQSTTESANEAAIGAEQEGGVSPDTVSAASQSIDEPTKDLVSVLVLKVEAVCGAVAVEGDSTAVALQVGQVRPSQLGNISLRQYLSNRSLEPPGPRGPPEVQARLESGPCAAARSPLAERSGFLQLRLHGYRGGFLSSTLQNLAHFLEDKSAPQVLPLEISVRDTHVDLKDDSARDNPSEPEPNPISVHVDRLLIHRRDDGSFSIGGNTDRQTVRQSVICHGDSDAIFLSLPPQMLVEENECLKVELSRAKMALAEAQMEKDSLLHQMRNLKMTS
uniref:Chorein N-terminal domain-containing protein n=1 Tax=Gadus morhua TaxID=8049 RepID=A0A8C5CYD2_GADMO